MAANRDPKAANPIQATEVKSSNDVAVDKFGKKQTAADKALRADQLAKLVASGMDKVDATDAIRLANTAKKSTPTSAL